MSASGRLAPLLSAAMAGSFHLVIWPWKILASTSPLMTSLSAPSTLYASATGPNTSGRFHAGLPPQRSSALGPCSSLSAESEPAKSTCFARNWSTPAPEPVGLYASVLPEQTWPHTLLNSAIAFCWAVEPSAVSEFLPAQSADDDDAVPDAAEEELVPALLSLPHADSVSAASAATGSVVP